MAFFSRKSAAAPVAETVEESAPPEEPPIVELEAALPPAEQAPALPESAPEPLRPLAAGAFLHGDIEIKEILYRGTVNCYFATAGEWGASQPKFLVERAAPPEPKLDLEASPLLPAATRFSEGGREYALFAWEDLQPFNEWRAPANDDTYLQTVRTLASGLAALEEQGCKPTLERESLFIDERGDPWFYGFADPAHPGDDPRLGLQTLADLSNAIIKTSLARGATLRLDDPLASLALSDEVKAFARALHGGEFASLAETVSALQAFEPVHSTGTALLSDVGMERELNEDCGLTFRLSLAGHSRNAELELLAVADGMGGHEGGEVASDLTLQSLQKAVLARLELDWHDNAAVRTAWRDVLEEVNAAVIRMNEDPPYAALRHKPGSTLICALRLGSRLFIGNVGDSRAYRWNAEGGLERLSKDHSYVQELIDAGRLAPEDAWGHPDSNAITSHIGMPRGVRMDVFLRLLRPGDKLFLVSDGVVDMLRDTEIEVIAREAGSAAELSHSLVHSANLAGGFDNITVAAMFCD